MAAPPIPPAGTALTLNPGESLNASIAAVLYSGVSEVARLDGDGTVNS